MSSIMESLVVFLCCALVSGHPEHYQDLHSGRNYNEYGVMGEYGYGDYEEVFIEPTYSDISIEDIYCKPYTSYDELPHTPLQLPVAMELWSGYAVPQLRKVLLQVLDESGEPLGCVDMTWGENNATTVTTSTFGTCIKEDGTNDQENKEPQGNNVQITHWSFLPSQRSFFLILMASENSLTFSLNGRKNETVSIGFSYPVKQLRPLKLIGDPHLRIHHSQQIGGCVSTDFQCGNVEAHLGTDDVVYINPSTTEDQNDAQAKVIVIFFPCFNSLTAPLNNKISGWRQLRVAYTNDRSMNYGHGFMENLHTITAFEGDNVLFNKTVVHPYSCQNDPVKLRIYHSLVSLNCKPDTGTESDNLGIETIQNLISSMLEYLRNMFPDV